MVEYATINSMSSFQGQNQLSKVNILQAYFELIMMKFHQFHLIFIQSIKLDYWIHYFFKAKGETIWRANYGFLNSTKSKNKNLA